MLDKSVKCLYLEHFCSGYHVKREKEKGEKNLEATEKNNTEKLPYKLEIRILDKK